jgi:hypothetical protein
LDLRFAIYDLCGVFRGRLFHEAGCSTSN